MPTQMELLRNMGSIAITAGLPAGSDLSNNHPFDLAVSTYTHGVVAFTETSINVGRGGNYRKKGGVEDMTFSLTISPYYAALLRALTGEITISVTEPLDTHGAIVGEAEFSYTGYIQAVNRSDLTGGNTAQDGNTVFNMSVTEYIERRDPPDISGSTNPVYDFNWKTGVFKNNGVDMFPGYVASG